MAKGAQDEAFLHGYTVLFGSTDNNYIQEEKFLDALKAKMVDGIIYVSFNPATSEKLLENITVPVVFMDRKIKKRENMGSVLIDNFSAMKDVAAYIAGKRLQTAGWNADQIYRSGNAAYRQDPSI